MYKEILYTPTGRVPVRFEAERSSSERGEAKKRRARRRQGLPSSVRSTRCSELWCSWKSAGTGYKVRPTAYSLL